MSAKKQRAISSFFTPASAKTAAVAPLVPSESTKRKLEHFLNSPKKRKPATGTSIAQQETPSKLSPEADLPAEDAVVEVPAVLESSVKRKATATRKTTTKKAPSKIKLTPLEQQFKDLKSANPDKVLAIQVGYKFKFFGNDAVVASQLLNIMLIRGNLDLEERNYERYAYCSIPDNRLHIHLQRLLNNGLKVGVVKQTETAAIKSVESKSGLFERKITGVYTKATYMGDELLTGDPTINRSNLNMDEVPDGESYIMCINQSDPKETAVMGVQPLTGDIVYDVFKDTPTRDHLETRLAYLNPSEVVIIGSSEEPSVSETKTVLKLKNPAVSIITVPRESQEVVQIGLVEFFSLVDPDGRSTHLADHYQESYLPAIRACVNELIRYLNEFKLSNVFTIPSNISSLTDAKMYMLLPGSTLRALDIFEVEEAPGLKKGTLVWLLDHTCTRNGSRLLRNWISRPLVNRTDIEHRLKAVEGLRQGPFVHILDAFKSSLVKLGKSGVDLDRLLIKIHYSATYSTDKISRKQLYLMLKSFSDILEIFRNFGTKGIDEFAANYDCQLIKEIMETLLEACKSTFVDDLLGFIDPGVALSDHNLNEQRLKYFNLGFTRFDTISAELSLIADIEESLEQELQSIRKYLKRPQLTYVSNLKDTHLIEVRNGKAVDSLPSDWIKISGTKAVSRFRTPAVSQLHRRLQYHNDTVLRRCDECFNTFLLEVDSHYTYLRQIVKQLAVFDCLLALATTASDTSDISYVRPELVDDQVVNVKRGSHPVLVKLSQQNSVGYVPNDIDISYDKNRVLIITGPNMGGKSSLVKQVALFTIMAQIGCLLPCEEATLGIFDSIFIRMGASDNILKGKSTFMVEMLESADIINSYTLKSLVILDEIGRGTGTSDGIALAYSILKYIIEDTEKSPLTLFITHYPSLHTLENEFSVVKNYHMAFLERTKNEGKTNEWPEVIFLYKLVEGVVSNLYGLNVAKLAGIDHSIINAAYEVSEKMKKLIESQNLLRALSRLNRDNAAQTLHEICQSL